MPAVFAKTAFLETGFTSNVRIEIGSDGVILRLDTEADASPGDHLADIIVAGMPNLHSHAFQRATAGLTEHASGGSDTFWTWRSLMYDLAARITPEDLKAIAAQAYLEFLKSGYTSVAEFHYLHGMAGASSPLDMEMSEAIITSAEETGIALTHLPVLYEVSGFGETQPTQAQKTFHHTPDDFIDLVEKLVRSTRGKTDVEIGIGLHSLRAVRHQSLIDIDKWAKQIMAGRPVHIHIAEQEKELHDCLEHYGARPVEWLMSAVDVTDNWCLVHATHMTASEIEAAIKAGATAGLCPTTEANLGDGFFELPHWLELGGALGVGSDSNVCPSPVEELRLLEYGSRLRERRRLISTSPEHPGTGAYLWSAAARGGARALGRKTGSIKVGNKADFLALDAQHPSLCAAKDSDILNALVFGPSSGAIRDVYVSGVRVIEGGRHEKEEEITAQYRKCVARLLDG